MPPARQNRQNSEKGAAETVTVAVVAGLFIAAVSLASALIARADRDNLTFSEPSGRNPALWSQSCPDFSPGELPAATVSAAAGGTAQLARPVSETYWNADFDGDGRAGTARLNTITLPPAGQGLLAAGSVLRVNTSAGCWHFAPPPETPPV